MAFSLLIIHDDIQCQIYYNCNYNAIGARRVVCGDDLCPNEQAVPAL